MILRIFTLLVGAGLAIAGSLSFWPVTSGVDFYRPIVLFIAGYILAIALAWVYIDITGRILLKIYKKKPSKNIEKYANHLLSQGMNYIDALASAHITVTGKQYLPKNERFLFVCNHISNFDPMISAGKFESSRLAFVTKPKNMNIPLGKNLMPILSYQPIDREDKLKSLQTFKTCSELISSQTCSIGIYPEGTRGQDDSTLLEFHEGVFNVAKNAKCPIVVTTIVGTKAIHHIPHFKPCRIYHDIIGVISYEEIENMTAHDIAIKVAEMMQTQLDKRHGK